MPSKIDKVSLDMLMICVSLTLQPRMIKLFNSVKAEKGSAQPFSSPQKVKPTRPKLVNTGKFRDFGNIIVSG